MPRRARTRLAAVFAATLVVASACSGADTREATPVPATTTPERDTTAPSPATTVIPSTVTPSTVMPSTVVPTTSPTAPSRTEPLPTEPPPTTVADRDFSGVDPVVSGFVEDTGLNGAALVVVDRDDGIVHEQYWGEFDADRVSLIASSSKMITAGVLMRLHDDGLLDIDAPVVDTVDWATDNPDITIAQLVSNSSGLVGLLPNPAYGPYACQFRPEGDIEECGAAAFQTPDDDADIVPPDTEFRYGGVQWQIAGAVAETVSGKTWAELIDEIYVEPCGVTSLGYGNHWAQPPEFFGYHADFAELPPTENPNMEGGAYIDPPDYAALLLMHLSGGECPNGRVMSADAIDRMHQDRVLAEYGDAGPTSLGYGMGWWVDRATGQLSDPGAYGSVAWLDVADGYGAFLVIEASAGQGGEIAAELNPIVEAAMTGGAA